MLVTLPLVAGVLEHVGVPMSRARLRHLHHVHLPHRGGELQDVRDGHQTGELLQPAQRRPPRRGDNSASQFNDFYLNLFKNNLNITFNTILDLTMLTPKKAYAALLEFHDKLQTYCT